MFHAADTLRAVGDASGVLSARLGGSAPGEFVELVVKDAWDKSHYMKRWEAGPRPARGIVLLLQSRGVVCCAVPAIGSPPAAAARLTYSRSTRRRSTNHRAARQSPRPHLQFSARSHADPRSSVTQRINAQEREAQRDVADQPVRTFPSRTCSALASAYSTRPAVKCSSCRVLSLLRLFEPNSPLSGGRHSSAIVIS